MANQHKQPELHTFTLLNPDFQMVGHKQMRENTYEVNGNKKDESIIKEEF